MPSAPDPHTVGRHLLGPHVVGQRVVVRHVVRGETGPTGGPALNDVLGTCVSWSGGVVVIESERGRVEVAVADIVSGKPVPPRPSVRHRDSPRSVELHTHVLWPDLVAEPLGEWVLRCAPAYDGRLRRRASSTLAMGDPGMPLAEAADTVRRWHREHDREPMVMAVLGSEVESGLLALDWRDLGNGSAHCQVAGVARALRSCDAVSAGRAAPVPRLEEEPDRLVVHLGDGAATGRATLDGDWVVLDSLDVDPGQRRQGLATHVLAELLDWAASRGALTAVLQVETDNPGAARLYERLGFVTHHTYRYLVAPAGTS
ncbi:GNAT family N-acetyltransferase [Nocardioides sediminis]|uniref:GNAT family N-acetyltransferase n=1 Tax=Nocardioides sediminis TaxID=433648 RepID=UPI000D3165CB|nr:GNAT family N-acetyltransferase [Nocardioides sediminis]